MPFAVSTQASHSACDLFTNRCNSNRTVEVSMSKDAQNILLRCRIVDIDHYSTEPIPYLDPQRSPLSGAQLPSVPVVRVFGTTPGGQKVCAHIHKVFPYFYVPLDESVSKATSAVEEYLAQFGLSLQLALSVSAKQAAEKNRDNQWHSSKSDNRPYIYNLNVIWAKSIYGYAASLSRFIKIEFTDPWVVRKAEAILRSGAVMQTKFTPLQSHIPYSLQFCADYNLYGMDFLDFDNMTFRQPLPSKLRRTCTLHKWFRRHLEPAYESSLQSPDPSPATTSNPPSGSPSSDSALSSVLPPGHDRVFLQSDTPPHLLASLQRKKLTCCDLEIDATPDHIVNRRSLPTVPLSQVGAVTDDEIRLVQSLAQIWKNERTRRKAERKKRKETTISMSPWDPLEAPSSPPREIKGYGVLTQAYHDQIRQMIPSPPSSAHTPTPTYSTPTASSEQTPRASLSDPDDVNQIPNLFASACESSHILSQSSAEPAHKLPNSGESTWPLLSQHDQLAQPGPARALQRSASLMDRVDKRMKSSQTPGTPGDQKPVTAIIDENLVLASQIEPVLLGTVFHERLYPLLPMLTSFVAHT